MSAINTIKGWAKRASSPACLASKAHGELYRLNHPERLPGSNFTDSLEDLPIIAKHLHEALRDFDYRPERGDAVEIISDPDTLALTHLAEGDFTVPVPECLLVVRKSFFIHKRLKREFAVDPEADIMCVVRPANEQVAAASLRLVKAQQSIALQRHRIYRGEYPSLVATPCWTCPNGGCRDALIETAPAICLRKVTRKGNLIPLFNRAV